MSDEYQLRKDIDSIYDDLYTDDKLLSVILDPNSDLNLVDDGNNKRGSLDAIFGYYGLKTINDRVTALENSIRSKISIDDAYPVGSIYISINSTSPATLFGGSWSQLSDAFLYAVSSNADTDEVSPPTGQGSKDAIVVSHTHGTGNSTYPNFLCSDVGVGITSNKKAHSNDSNGIYLLYTNDSGDITERTASETVGDDGTDKNMPPYLKVYMWKRTA